MFQNVVGIIVLVLLIMCLNDINLRVAVHHLIHPDNWTALQKLSKCGIIETIRQHDITVFGFHQKSSWTNSPPTCPFHKRDALPVNIIEMLTRHDLSGKRLGTSLFIEDGSDERICRKKIYLSGLTDEAIQEYVTHMQNLSYCEVNSCTDALWLSCRLTFLIHFNREPFSFELDAVYSIAQALTSGLNSIFTSNINKEKTILRESVEASQGGMTYRWLMNGMNKEDIYVELVHNIFGMTLQWTPLIRELAETESPPETLPDAAEMILKILPARVAASRVDEGLVIHDLVHRCRHAQIPVTFAKSTNPSHIVHDSQLIASENDSNYVPFGYGLRRCPGEWLTYYLLMKLRIKKNKNIKGDCDTIRVGLNICS